MKLRLLFLALLLLALPTGFCMSDAEPAPEQTRGPKAKEFYRLQAEMNTILGELADLQIKYRTANLEKRAEIQQQSKSLIAEGEKIEPLFIEAAKNAYAEAPNADKEIAALMAKLLAQCVENDNYEPAAEIGKLLMENGCTEKSVPNLAGIAAYAVGDFDAAAKYLHQADEAGYYRTASPKDKLAQLGFQFLQTVGDMKDAWEKEKAIRDREAVSDNLPRVLLKTNKGDIVVELYENQAPNTVANFLYLVKKGFYNGLSFHRVLQGFMAQGGDPNGDGSGGCGYSIACECYRPDYRHHFRGTLSMAHAGRDTGGSQFFITFVPTPHLDGKHTVFGRVIEGMDVLAKLQRRDPNDKEAPRADRIIEAKVLRSRPHPYVPKKMAE